ncbi:uncharacterized protein LOC125437372 isoform X4 [Sphaerodactylus townsendi]|uniref:uncharacterized protein LOC125437372 isoform X4 n=1 Tax=Sphaerodactylus townsendi TaxID=933632 RepID=UPI002026A604|nr:uncharacterized protein LOC125437372 isoform X4 [Sphaerodactylus townsendi]
MSESSSGLNTSCLRFSASHSPPCSDLSDPEIPLSVLSSRNRELLQHSCDSGIASPLPSDSVKYLTWHELEEHDVQGSQIRCPRVREGPSAENRFCRGKHHIHCARKQVKEQEKWGKRLQENWEDCMSLNLSYQDLGDLYQVENFKRILRRLIRVERLWLVDNSLGDLSAICLPSVFSKLPNLKMLDGIPKLPEDRPPHTSFLSKTCTIL